MPRLLIAAAALRATLPTLTAQAQRYPTKPIRLVVPFPPAGIAEILARIIGQKMTESLGQQMVIEPTTPEELQKLIHTDIQRWAKAVRIAGATLN